MQNRVTYEYSIIRLVPKVEREEFINLGAIVFSKRKKYLGIKYKIDQRRIKYFSDEIDIDHQEARSFKVQKHILDFALILKRSLKIFSKYMFFSIESIVFKSSNHLMGGGWH